MAFLFGVSPFEGISILFGAEEGARPHLRNTYMLATSTELIYLQRRDRAPLGLGKVAMRGSARG